MISTIIITVYVVVDDDAGIIIGNDDNVGIVDLEQAQSLTGQPLKLNSCRTAHLH